jgi:hypothetical protein
VDADVAEALRALVRRVRHNVPSGHDPERFHVEKSEIERALAKLADRFDVGPRRRQEPRRPVITTELIGGRRIMVQKTRMPFAIFVGGTPMAGRP